MRQLQLVYAFVIVLAATDCTNAATIRGKVLFGMQGVPKVEISLVEDSPGFTFVSPDRITTTTQSDGSFLIEHVDPAKEWKLVVWDPFVPGRIGAVAHFTNPTTHDLIIHLSKQLYFTEPTTHAYLTQPTVRLAWTSLPEAAAYRLSITDGDYRTVITRETTDPVLQIALKPGQYYEASVLAFDRSRVEIGADIIHEGAAFSFGVADPKAEAELKPADGLCVIRGKAPELYVAPTKATRAKAPFMICSGDTVKLIGARGKWFKVRLQSGYFPGELGWLPADDLACRR